MTSAEGLFVYPGVGSVSLEKTEPATDTFEHTLHLEDLKTKINDVEIHYAEVKQVYEALRGKFNYLLQSRQELAVFLMGWSSKKYPLPSLEVRKRLNSQLPITTKEAVQLRAEIWWLEDRLVEAKAEKDRLQNLWAFRRMNGEKSIVRKSDQVPHSLGE